MAIDYKGICIHRLGENVIESVRVRLPDGRESDIDAGTYLRQGAHPSLHTLPDCQDLAKLKRG